MSKEWEGWEAGIPALTKEQQKYTATLLKTLRELLAAPFEWTLTGGTALQSYLPVQVRRYSTDIEIMTEAKRSEVEAWLRRVKKDHKSVAETVILAEITPQGTLFVFHDYPAADHQLSKSKIRPFEHFPIPDAPPPSTLKIPTASIDFLLASKLFFLQKDDRGGERHKDVSDLHLAIDLGAPEEVKRILTGIIKHMKSDLNTEEVIRRAGIRIRLTAGPAYPEFVKWHKRMLPQALSPPAVAALNVLVSNLEMLLGGSIKETSIDKMRFLLHQIPIKQVGAIAVRHGYKGKTTMQYEKLYDFVTTTCLQRMVAPFPADDKELVARLMA